MASIQKEYELNRMKEEEKMNCLKGKTKANCITIEFKDYLSYIPDHLKKSTYDKYLELKAKEQEIEREKQNFESLVDKKLGSSRPKPSEAVDQNATVDPNIAPMELMNEVNECYKQVLQKNLK